MRESVRGLKPAEVMRQAVNNPAIANAVLQLPDGIPGMNDESMMQHIEKVALPHNVGELYEIHATKKPTPDDVLAHGRDEAAIKAYADTALKNYEQGKEDVKLIGDVIMQTVSYYALVADIDPKDAFDAIGLGD